MQREALHVLAAEMVYSQPLVVPGEFFPSPLNNNTTQSTKLQTAMWSAQPLTPGRPTRHSYREPYRTVYGRPRVQTP